MTPSSAARRVDERAAGEAVVHGRGRADDLIDRAAAPGRQRAADHRHDAGARRRRVAPRARDGEREVARRARGGGQRDRLRVEPGDAQHGQARRRIPADELGVERVAVVAPDVQAVLAAERATIVSTTLSAYTRPLAGRRRPCTCTTDGRGGGDGVGERIREGGQQFGGHGPIVAHARGGWIAQRVASTAS